MQFRLNWYCQFLLTHIPLNCLVFSNWLCLKYTLFPKLFHLHLLHSLLFLSLSSLFFHFLSFLFIHHLIKQLSLSTPIISIQFHSYWNSWLFLISWSLLNLITFANLHLSCFKHSLLSFFFFFLLQFSHEFGFLFSTSTFSSQFEWFKFSLWLYWRSFTSFWFYVLKVRHGERNKFKGFFSLFERRTSHFSCTSFWSGKRELFKKNFFMFFMFRFKEVIGWHLSCFKLGRVSRIMVLWFFHWFSLFHSFCSLKLKWRMVYTSSHFPLNRFEKRFFKHSFVKFSSFEWVGMLKLVFFVYHIFFKSFFS